MNRQRPPRSKPQPARRSTRIASPWSAGAGPHNSRPGSCLKQGKHKDAPCPAATTAGPPPTAKLPLWHGAGPLRRQVSSRLVLPHEELGVEFVGQAASSRSGVDTRPAPDPCRRLGPSKGRQTGPPVVRAIPESTCGPGKPPTPGVRHFLPAPAAAGGGSSPSRAERLRSLLPLLPRQNV